MLLFPHCYCHTARVISHCLPSLSSLFSLSLLSLLSLSLLSLSFSVTFYVLHKQCSAVYLLRALTSPLRLPLLFSLDFSYQTGFQSSELICTVYSSFIHSCISQRVNSRSVEDKYILIADFFIGREGERERERKQYPTIVSNVRVLFCFKHSCF